MGARSLADPVSAPARPRACHRSQRRLVRWWYLHGGRPVHGRPRAAAGAGRALERPGLAGAAAASAPGASYSVLQDVACRAASGAWRPTRRNSQHQLTESWQGQNWRLTAGKLCRRAARRALMPRQDRLRSRGRRRQQAAQPVLDRLDLASHQNSTPPPSRGRCPEPGVLPGSNLRQCRIPLSARPAHRPVHASRAVERPPMADTGDPQPLATAAGRKRSRGLRRLRRHLVRGQEVLPAAASSRA